MGLPVMCGCPVGQELSEDDVNRFLDDNRIDRENFWALRGELFVD